MTKKSLITLFTAIGILFSVLQSQAGTFTAFGPKTFVRGSGKPVVETASFSIKNPNTTYTLKVYNGGINSEYPKVSSAITKLNGSTIFDTSDFNQQVSQLQKQVAVAISNTLSVELRSSPGSGLTVLIEGEDGTPPSVVINSPINGAYLNNPSVTISGTASDAISWVNTITVNGTTAQLSSESYTSTVKFTEGLNTIAATATDQAGNTGSAAVSVILDTIPPKIIIDSLPSLINKPQLTITGKIEDASSTSSLTINGKTVVAIGQSPYQFSSDITLSEGNNTITITATDKAGNIGNVSTTVVLDTIPPVVTITYPVNQALLNTKTVTVTGAVTDTNGISVVNINGIKANIQNGSYNATINLIEGVNAATVRAVDNAGNIGSATVTTISDTTPPVIAIASPSNGSIVDTGIITVTGTIDDNAATVTVNGINAIVTNNTFTVSGPRLVEGSNTITVIARDPAGNLSTTSSIVTYASGPVLTIQYPTDGSTFNYPYTEVRVSVNDPTATVTINGKPATNGLMGPFMPPGPQMEPVSLSSSNDFYGFIELVEGANTIMVSATNLSGRTSSSSITVYYYDTVPPSIWVIYPSYYDYTTPTETITVSVNIYDYSTPTVTINGIQAIVTKNKYSADYITTATIKLVKGYNDITIIATDSAGNTSTATRTISYSIPDTTAPVISITSPADGSGVNSTQVTITGTIDDDKAYVKVNGDYAFLENNLFRKTIVLPIEGANTIVVTATDTAGNKSSSTITVYKDTTFPSVTFTAPPFNATGVSIGSNISVNFTESINASTITTSTFTLSSEMGFVSGTVIYDGNTAIFKPAYPLNSNTIFTATIRGGSGGVKDLAGNSLATDYAWVFKTGVGAVGVDITEPSNGATLNKSAALVKGTITAQTPDVGIRVNGIIAEINGTNWVAQVQLQIGQNMIEATVTDISGNTDKKSVTINTETTEQPVTINTNPQSGVAPVNSTFSINTSISNTVTSYKIDFEGDGVTDLETTTTSGITHTYDTPGIYYPTLTVTDSQNNTYTETTVVNVLSKEEMDVLLKGKWEGMKGAMIGGDATTAINYFEDSVTEKYSRVFTDLGSDLPSIAASLEDITLISFTGDIAEYAIGRNQDGKRYIYFIYFMKDENGIWKIKGM